MFQLGIQRGRNLARTTREYGYSAFAQRLDLLSDIRLNRRRKLVSEVGDDRHLTTRRAGLGCFEAAVLCEQQTCHGEHETVYKLVIHDYKRSV